MAQIEIGTNEKEKKRKETNNQSILNIPSRVICRVQVNRL
jgi:hypothetical protein